MANQYRVMPWESTSTCWLPMVFSETVFPPAAAALLLLPPAAGVLATADELLLPELAQAETVRAKAARPAAPHIFRIGNSPLRGCMWSPVRDHVRSVVSVHRGFNRGQLAVEPALGSGDGAQVGLAQPRCERDSTDRDQAGHGGTPRR